MRAINGTTLYLYVLRKKIQFGWLATYRISPIKHGSLFLCFFGGGAGSSRGGRGARRGRREGRREEGLIELLQVNHIAQKKNRY